MARQHIKILEHIPENRLPTSLQVFQRYEYIRKFNPSEETSVIYDIVIKEVISIWEKSYIPTMEEQNIKRKLIMLGKTYVSSKRHKKNLNDFNTLFDIKSKYGKFRNKDENFYLDQKNERKATMGPIDIIDNKKIESNQSRYNCNKSNQDCNHPKTRGNPGRRKLQVEPVTTPIEKRAKFNGSYSEINDSIYEGFNMSKNDKEDDPDWEECNPSVLKKRRAPENINVSLNASKLLDNLALMADKTMISSRKAVEIAGSTLSTAANDSENEDLSRLTLSHSSLHRIRDVLRLKHSGVITENWRRSKRDSKFLLHWDEKSLRHLRQVDGSNSYMAVVLTCFNRRREKFVNN